MFAHRGGHAERERVCLSTSLEFGVGLHDFASWPSCSLSNGFITTEQVMAWNKDGGPGGVSAVRFLLLAFKKKILVPKTLKYLYTDLIGGKNRLLAI